jgi:hypothetical protein
VLGGAQGAADVRRRQAAPRAAEEQRRRLGVGRRPGAGLGAEQRRQRQPQRAGEALHRPQADVLLPAGEQAADGGVANAGGARQVHLVPAALAHGEHQVLHQPAHHRRLPLHHVPHPPGRPGGPPLA